MAFSLRSHDPFVTCSIGSGEIAGEKLAEHADRHLFDSARRQLGELERAVGGPYQAGDLDPQRFEQFLDFAVLAFALSHRQPTVAALTAVERGLDRTIADAIDREAFGKPGKRRFIRLAMSPDPVGASDRVGRVFKIAREFAVVSQEQKSFGAD